jgi:hypothetical protein
MGKLFFPSIVVVMGLTYLIAMGLLFFLFFPMGYSFIYAQKRSGKKSGPMDC